MLFLLFQLGSDRYALDVGKVVEVLPLLQLKKIPNAPRGVAGIFNYRGRPVPAVDLSDLILGQPASERLTTRIIVMNYANADGKNHLLGLIAEQVTQMIRKDSKEFNQPGLNLGASPYLGPVLMDDRGIVQWVHEERLLAENVRDLLFAETAQAVV